MSPLTLSRTGSLDIDMSHYPAPPASSTGNSVGDTSSPASNTFSELTGRSPRTRPSATIIPTTTPLVDPVLAPVSLNKATTPAEQLRSALERRAKRVRESSQPLVCPPFSFFRLNGSPLSQGPCGFTKYSCKFKYLCLSFSEPSSRPHPFDIYLP